MCSVARIDVRFEQNTKPKSVRTCINTSISAEKREPNILLLKIEKQFWSNCGQKKGRLFRVHKKTAEIKVNHP